MIATVEVTEETGLRYPTRLSWDLEAIRDRVSRSWQIGLRQEQFVTTWGTLECDDFVPCAAFRGPRNEVFLFDGEHLYRINFERERDPQTIGLETHAEARRTGIHVVSVANRWFEAARVETPPIESR